MIEDGNTGSPLFLPSFNLFRHGFRDFVLSFKEVQQSVADIIFALVMVSNNPA